MKPKAVKVVPDKEAKVAKVAARPRAESKKATAKATKSSAKEKTTKAMKLVKATTSAKVVKSTASSKPVSVMSGKKELTVTPVKLKTKTDLIQHLMATEEAPTRKQVVSMLTALEDAMLGSVHKKGGGTFMLPGLFKVITKVIPAKEKRFGKNPFTGEEQWFKPKPASVRVKIRPMKKLKDVAMS